MMDADFSALLEKKLDNISSSVEEIKDDLNSNKSDVQMINYRLGVVETEQTLLKKTVEDLKQAPAKKTSEMVGKVLDWILKGALTVISAALLFYLQNLVH